MLVSVGRSLDLSLSISPLSLSSSLSLSLPLSLSLSLSLSSCLLFLLSTGRSCNDLSRRRGSTYLYGWKSRRTYTCRRRRPLTHWSALRGWGGGAVTPMRVGRKPATGQPLPRTVEVAEAATLAGRVVCCRWRWPLHSEPAWNALRAGQHADRTCTEGEAADQHWYHHHILSP